MIRKITSFSKALAILSVLEASDRVADSDNRWWVEAYQNGREQGIIIWEPNLAYYVAQHRNSDQIVVYKGKYSMQSISDDAYANKNFFSTVDEAVEWLENELAA